MTKRLATSLCTLVALVALALAGCGPKTAKTAAIPIAEVGRKTIEVTVEATGTVEPIDLIEVKSKASGQITHMPVAVGSVVKTGDLLAQIDTRDVENQYQQSLAAMRAAQAKADISKAQLKRAEDLYAQQITTADEHESAVLDNANSASALVKARTDLDIARQRRDDATVRAPSAGTVLSQAVAVGQVIASATSSVSGGTTLLTMADLSRIRVRALVSETDIGSVRPGMEATVTVDAFANRTFQGTVEKIEPQAVVQQSVTMFPVLVSLDNENGLLLPGMNGEVSVLVERRENVLAVPLDAVRSAREVGAVATALGLRPDSVSAQVERQVAARMAARADSMRVRNAGAGAGAGRDSLRSRRGAGFTAGGGRGGGRFGGANGRGGAGMGAAAAAGTTGGAGGGAGGGRAGRAQVVFVQTDKGLVPRVVRLGLSNYDDAQVIDGLVEGDKVALVSVAELQSKRTQDQAQLRSRISGTTPGIGGAGAGGGRGGGGGGGGGGR
jgi:HlyD family secretion protein